MESDQINRHRREPSRQGLGNHRPSIFTRWILTGGICSCCLFHPARGSSIEEARLLLYFMLLFFLLPFRSKKKKRHEWHGGMGAWRFHVDFLLNHWWLM
ncbi:hypothetical protein B0T19DRAFT_140872 [Cercophora scortea]|uniref:Uncharacterized protein n=1 Tax=Cercophora scortea TaxID=314031 RepID=A0AAE0MK09_9PEZI|nr:hypothetical protein B0T19DRAFT_140872 [Cercophora scortea]